MTKLELGDKKFWRKEWRTRDSESQAHWDVREVTVLLDGPRGVAVFDREGAVYYASREALYDTKRKADGYEG